MNILTKKNSFLTVLFSFFTLFPAFGAGIIPLESESSCLPAGQADYSYTLVINGKDCNKCSMLANATLTSDMKSVKYLYLIDIPTFARKDFLLQLGVSDTSLEIINNNPCFDKLVAHIPNTAGEMSGVIKYNKQTNKYFFSSLKALRVGNNKRDYFDEPIAEKFPLKFEKYIDNVESFVLWDDLYCMTFSSLNNLYAFNKKGELYKEMEVDTNFWKLLYTIYYEKVLPDSIKQLNPFGTSLQVYEQYVKPLGQSLYSFKQLCTQNGYLYVTLNTYVSVNWTADNVRHDGVEFVLKIDKKWNVVDYYLLPRGGLDTNYSGATFYGFGVGKKGVRSFVYPIDKIEIKETNYFTQAYTFEKKNALNPVKYNGPVLTAKSLSEFGLSKNFFALQHSYIGDSIVYFRNMPVVMYLNKGDSAIMEQLPKADSIDSYINMYTTVNKYDELRSLVAYNGYLFLSTYSRVNGEMQKNTKRIQDFIETDDIVVSAYIDSEEIYILTINDTKGIIIYKVKNYF